MKNHEVTTSRIGLKMLTLSVIAVTIAGCSPRDSGGLTQRLSISTGGTGGVYYPYGGGVAKVISDHLDGVEATAEVTAGTVDNLKFIASRESDLAIGLADSIDDAAAGRGAFVDFGQVPARTIAVLYDNLNQLVTVEGQGIESVTDLRDRIVSTGAPGSGTEITALRVLAAEGLDPDADMSRQSLGVGQSVDALKDGKIDAFFWSGGVPTGAVLDLASTPGRTVKLVPNTSALPFLHENFGDTVYHAVTIPQITYPGMNSDVEVIGVANMLVAHEEMDAELAYRITQALFENHAELAAVHAEAAKLSLDTAVVGSTIPFHEGAIRYYREQGVWPES
ncbi:MAG: TAXI family TRAP transporter solute-binding subunit [Acidobacteriota bacterium]|nr:TAXI family TRAP transporter solute-binding subunit [Acidobacteriota bacterium]